MGLSATLLVAILSALDMWQLLGNRAISLTRLAYHFAARIFGFVAVPLVVYLAFFAVHFALLSKSGPGDAFMSTAFQVCSTRLPSLEFCLTLYP